METALNLVEIYPKLIQHKSCDRLWEFISKTAFYNRKEESSRNSKSGRNTKEEAETVTETSEIPKISVTQVEDNPNKTRSVFFCGNITDDVWQSLVIGLSNKFFVGSCKEKTISTSETETETILSADYFVFVIEDKTINNSYYLNQLHTALTWRIPVTFVRDPGFIMPDPLPESVFTISDNGWPIKPRADQEEINIRAPSKMESKTKSYRHETRALSEGQIDKEIEIKCLKKASSSNTHKTSRPISSYSQYSSDTSLSLNLPAISSSQTTVTELRKSHSVSSYLSSSGHSNSVNDFETIAVDTTSRQSLQNSHSRSLTRDEYVNGLNDSDKIDFHKTLPKNKVVSFSEFLSRGYDTAVLYHRLYHRECLDRIAAVLKDEVSATETDLSKVPDLGHTNQDTSDRKTEEVAIIKDGDGGTNTDSATSSKPEVTKETKQKKNNKKRISLESETSENQMHRKLSSPIETFYVVYSDSKDGPELVHWPVPEHREVSGSPSLESFGFQDVDLSLKVNIDLSSDDEN